MKEIKDWEARRSGGRITVKGYDAGSGEPLTVGSIDAIQPLDGKLIATHKSGEEFRLLTA